MWKWKHQLCSTHEAQLCLTAKAAGSPLEVWSHKQQLIILCLIPSSSQCSACTSEEQHKVRAVLSDLIC